MDQRTKAMRVHDAIFDSYTKHKVFGRGAIAVSFRFEEVDGGFKATEIFRNVDAAEAYYSHFMKNKVLCCHVLTNLPWRQGPGPDAAVTDGNVRAYVTNVARLAEGPQTVKYNHLKTESNPSGKIEVVEWTTPPTPAELEEQFGKFHFGFAHRPTVAETDTSEGAASKPAQQQMH
eukprot:CAMPEP_0204571054 /NCGR_PEP_ID=MMETSP0661-20131031/38663_1 /ASSEMBLY_ACC=CAM_ASM_000606 /TAXON_ID=109239 /ORGANISM="Alexandrium margalefi, Strain AMGDE01CS-322" /LENGTH=174 /DNA_ID=CAMNT_0051579279 /DNA_START=188 /DNA_END=712 /DNA_ORIENTATION=+